MVVFGFRDDETQTPDAIAAAIGAAWSASGSMQDSQDINTVLSESRTLIRRSGNLVAGVDFPNTTGQVAGEGAPPQVAALFQKLTGFAGRNRRGRMYLPGVPTTFETGLYAAATVANFQTRANNFMSALATNDTPMALLHTDPVDPPIIVTELRAVPLSATQRRRIR